MGCTESREPVESQMGGQTQKMRKNQFKILELEIRRSIPEIKDIEALKKLSKPSRSKKLSIKKPKPLNSAVSEELTDLELKQVDLLSMIEPTSGLLVRKDGLMMFTGVQNSFFSPKSEYILKWNSSVHSLINLNPNTINDSIGQFLQLLHLKKYNCHFALTAQFDFSKNKNGEIVCYLYKIDNGGNISKFSTVLGYSGVKNPLSKGPMENFLSVQTGSNSFIVFTDLDKSELKACTSKKFPTGSSFWNKEQLNEEEFRYTGSNDETVLRNLTGNIISTKLYGVQKISLCTDLGEIRAYEFGGFEDNYLETKSKRKTISIDKIKSKKKSSPESNRRSLGPFVNKIGSHDLSLYMNEVCESFTALKSGELYAIGTVFSNEQTQNKSSKIKRLIVLKLTYNAKHGSTWMFDFEHMEIMGSWNKLYINFFNQNSPVVIAVHSDSSKVVDARKNKRGKSSQGSSIQDRFCNLFIGRVTNQRIEKVNYLIDFIHERFQSASLVGNQLFFLDKKMRICQVNFD